jgi:endoglucanase
MLKNKFGKKLVSLATAGVMSLSAAATTISTIATTATTASAATANELLGAGDFNDGVGLPWHICESLTGDMDFVIQDGVYVVHIVNPGGKSNGGEDRWDCQFRHRGLTIRMGHTYRITYSVWTSNAGTMYSKLGDMTNDDQENWHLNGTPLSMPTYTGNESLSDVEQNLLKASASGSTVEYWQGWDAWKNNTIPANTWTTVAYEFTVADDGAGHCADSIGTGEWTFHFGGDGQYTSNICFPVDTILKFDNLALIDMNSSEDNYVAEEEYDVQGIELNQVGFYPNLNKKATIAVEQGDSSPKTFEVKDSSGNTVYTGETSGYNTKADEGDWGYSQIIDFSDFTTEGTGYYVVCGDKKSVPFDISNNIYDGMLTNALNYFYQNRSGVDIKSEYITSKGQNDSKDALARKAGHVNDTAYIETSWLNVIPSNYDITSSDGKAHGYTFKDQAGQITHNDGTITSTTGWYDAGDHGKYVVNGGISVWTLNNLYERSLAQGDASKWDDNSGTMLIPENGNSIPDILDETMVETDFFLEMQDSDGMVHHKLHDFKWTALCVAPADDPLERIVKPVTYAATLNAAAAWAQSSRLLDDINSTKAQEKAATYLAAAEKAYDAAKTNYEKNGSTYNANDSMFAPIEDGKGGGAYGDTYVDDEFYWAACELYLTTGDSKYYTDLSAFKDAFKVETSLVGGENEGTASAFTWGTLSSVGTMSLALNTTGVVSDSDLTKINDSIVEAGDYFLNLEANSQYGIDYKGLTYSVENWTFDSTTNTGKTSQLEVENAYEWGSNSMVINNAVAMAYAYDVTGEVKYINGVVSAFDYLLGRNPLEQSYVTGYGEHATQYVHHRYWSHYNSEDFPYCPDGVLSGGPNSAMQDPMIQGAGYKVGTIAPMTCYYDQLEAWSVNECTINWNSPLCYIVSFLEDEAPNVSTDELSVTVKPSTIAVGDTATITATVGGSQVSFTATTSDSAVTISGATITGAAEGKATVTVTTADGKTKDVTITVTAAEETSATTTTTVAEEDTTTTTTTTTTDAEEKGETVETAAKDDASVLWGDVNVDKVVDVGDVVLLNKSIVNAASLSSQGKLNANCYYDSVINAKDAGVILKRLVMTYKQEELPIEAE